MGWILSFFILSILIIFHEFGHFLLAKINGVEVEEFSLGFGPRLLSVTKGGTRYSIKLLLFGGACIMKGTIDASDTEELTKEASASAPEEPETEQKHSVWKRGRERVNDGSFLSASVGRRASIVFAGPLFNFLLAFISAVIVISLVGIDPPVVLNVENGSAAEAAGLEKGDIIKSFRGKKIVIGRDLSADLTFNDISADTKLEMVIERDGTEETITYMPDVSVVYRLGISYQSDDSPAEVLSVVKDSPLELAGIQAGDTILEINGTTVKTGADFMSYIQEHPLDGSEVRLVYLHGNKEKTAVASPVETSVADMGFVYNLYRDKTTAVQTVKYSAYEVWYWIRTTVQSLGYMFSGNVSLDDFAGPVGIANMVDDTYSEAKSAGALMVLVNLLNLIIFLSADLGVMNLLPIPAVDGGRLLFILIEAIRGKPVNRRIEAAIELVTVVLLLGLMLLVMYNDILRLF